MSILADHRKFVAVFHRGSTPAILINEPFMLGLDFWSQQSMDLGRRGGHAGKWSSASP